MSRNVSNPKGHHRSRQVTDQIKHKYRAPQNILRNNCGVFTQVLGVKESNEAMYLVITIFGHVIRGQTRSNVFFFSKFATWPDFEGFWVIKNENDNEVVLIHSHNMTRNVLNTTGHHRSRQITGQIKQNSVK